MDRKPRFDSRSFQPKASRQGHDIDHAVRIYSVQTKQGRMRIRHGSGPMWSFGTPDDRDVWESVHYEEAMIKAARWVIIDARGQFANGDGVDEVTARTLDRLLDGACLK